MKRALWTFDLQRFAEEETAAAEGAPETTGALESFDALFGPDDADEDTPEDTSANEPEPEPTTNDQDADEPDESPADARGTDEPETPAAKPARVYAGKYATEDDLKRGTRELAKRFGLPADALEFGDANAWESAYQNLFRRFSAGEHLADNPNFQAARRQQQQAAAPQQPEAAKADQPTAPTPEEAEAARQRLIEEFFVDPEGTLLKLGERLVQQRLEPVLQPLVQSGVQQRIGATLQQFEADHPDFKELQGDINQHIQQNRVLQMALATKDPEVVRDVLETAYHAVRGSTRDAAIQAAIEAARAEGQKNAQAQARAQTTPASSRAAQASPAADTFTELFGEPERLWE